MSHGGDRVLRAITGVAELGLRTSTVVTAAVLLRIVGYDQLRRLAYAGLDASSVRRHVGRAVDARFLRRWNFRVPGYGRIGHVHPTARANDAVLGALGSSIGAPPWQKTIDLMLPSSTRRPLELSDHVPKWFPHQREVNHIVTSILCSARAPLAWASSWESPFPKFVGAIEMPQPDYVLVEDGPGPASVVFGEHDRGYEPVERFIARKVALYSRLTAACEPMLGIRTFRVDVSVIDALGRHPIDRLRKLLDATRAYGATDLVRFTLGGWLFADPSHAVWFSDTGPTSDSVRVQDHAVGAGPVEVRSPP